MKLGIRYIDSDKDSHFTEALITDAIEMESIDMPSDFLITETHECVIENVTIQSKQKSEWDVFIFSKASGANADLDQDTFIDGFIFPSGEASQIAGTGQYYYRSMNNNVSIPYRDKDFTGKVHVGLINRSTAAKLAGATGEVKVRLMVRAVYGV